MPFRRKLPLLSLYKPSAGMAGFLRLFYFPSVSTELALDFAHAANLF